MADNSALLKDSNKKQQEEKIANQDCSHLRGFSKILEFANQIWSHQPATVSIHVMAFTSYLADQLSAFVRFVLRLNLFFSLLPPHL